MTFLSGATSFDWGAIPNLSRLTSQSMVGPNSCPADNCTSLLSNESRILVGLPIISGEEKVAAR